MLPISSMLNFPICPIIQIKMAGAPTNNGPNWKKNCLHVFSTSKMMSRSESLIAKKKVTKWTTLLYNVQLKWILLFVLDKKYWTKFLFSPHTAYNIYVGHYSSQIIKWTMSVSRLRCQDHGVYVMITMAWCHCYDCKIII